MLKIHVVDLAGINFSDFTITCYIYSKICDEFNISGKYAMNLILVGTMFSKNGKIN